MSEKLRRLREAVANANPELAAQAAAARFERDAIAVPAELSAPEGAPRWQRRRAADVAELYRSLVIAGPQGLSLTGLQASVFFGQDRIAQAIKTLRTSNCVTESRRGTDGFDVDRIVLRAVP